MDRYGYQDEIRRAAAKSVKDLNLSNASEWRQPASSHHQRASVSARIEQLQQQHTTNGATTSPRRKSLGATAATNKHLLYSPHQASQTLKAPLNGAGHQQGKEGQVRAAFEDSPIQ